jgi:hypothetical protein
MKTIIIPFSGFYNSVHSSLLDDAENQIFENRSGVCVSEDLQEKFYRACDYSYVCKQYAKAYATFFAEKLELPLKFESLESPREYNFTTDRIFCNIEDATIAKLFDETNTSTLRITAAKNHTSREGFYSFYDPDIDTWGEVQEWDHNELGTLLEAWMLDHFHDLFGAYQGDTWTQWDEHALMVNSVGNGLLDKWLCSDSDTARIVNIADYLRSREDRKFR